MAFCCNMICKKISDFLYKPNVKKDIKNAIRSCKINSFLFYVKTNRVSIRLVIFIIRTLTKKKKKKVL